MKESNSYILGTDREELYRLGLQHQVWASEARRGWEIGGFSAGHTILDLGCGPGFCTQELAFIVGQTGKVIGVDKSSHYIHFLNKIKELYQLNIEAIEADFNEMVLTPNSLDGIYCRWAMAWIPNPKETLAKAMQALKPGGKIVIQEYYDWSTHQTEPNFTGLTKAIKACLKSFKESEGEIDIGRELPKIFNELGANVISTRPMAKLARPGDLTWQWPKSFYYSYFPRLVDTGYLTEEEVKYAFKDFKKLEQIPEASINCPILIEVIAEK